ncbi:MAG: acyltransferase family protein [Vulcanimicrobiota bacterium]
MNARWPPQGYRVELDGLRGLAIILVLLYHFKFGLSGGFVGVDAFFVLSGYLIGGYLLTHLRAGTLSLREFWKRRCLRLLPALVPMTVGTAWAAWLCLLPDELARLGQVLLGQSLLAPHVGIWHSAKFGYFADPSETQPLLHLWSLGVEEQFYLFLPPLLLALRPKRAGAAFLGLLFASLACSYWQTRHQPLAAFYLPFARVWELALGAWVSTGQPVRGRVSREVLGWLGFAFILGSASQYSYSTPLPGLAATVPCLGAALLIAAGGQKPVTTWERLLSVPPLVWLGLISYSLYLFHWPLLAFASYLRCWNLELTTRIKILLASIVLAAFYTHFIEKPMRRSQFWGDKIGLLCLCFLILCAWSGWSLWRADGYPARLYSRALEYFRDDPYFKSKQVTVSDIRQDQVAELGDPNGSGPPFLVWGDSNGMVLCSMLDALGKQYHCPGYGITHGNTAPLVHSKPLASNFQLSSDEESQWGEATLDFIRRHKIKKVFLVCIWSSYPIGDKEIPATLAALHQAGAGCWIMAPISQPEVDIRRAAILADRGLLPPPEPLPVAMVSFYRKIFEERISKCPPGSYQLIDPLTILRDSKTGSFPYFQQGKLLYHDPCHLSIEGNRRLQPLFETAFRAGTKK